VANINNLIQQVIAQRNFWRQETQRLILEGADPHIIPAEVPQPLPPAHIPLIRQVQQHLQRLVRQRNYWRQATQLITLALHLPPVHPPPLVNMAALATEKNKLDSIVRRNMDEWNNFPQQQLAKSHNIPIFNGTPGEVETYINTVKNLVKTLNIPTKGKTDEMVYPAPATIQDPLYTYAMVANPAGYRIAAVLGGGNRGEGNKWRDGQQLAPIAEAGAAIVHLSGREPILPVGHCRRAEQVIDALVLKWGGMAALLWKNTNENERPKTLEPYRYYYMDNGVERRIPVAIGLYEFLRRNYQSQEQESLYFDMWDRMEFSPSYPGGIQAYNVAYINAMNAARLTSPENLRIVINRYIDTFGRHYPSIHREMKRYKSERSLQLQPPTLMEMQGYVLRRLIDEQPREQYRLPTYNSEYIKKERRQRETRGGFSKLTRAKIHNINEQIDNFEVHGRYQGSGKGGAFRGEAVELDKSEATCFKCGEKGHWARDKVCRKTNNGKTEIIYNNCGKSGHMKKDCRSKPSRYMQRNDRKTTNLNKSTIRCFNCNGTGHMAGDCPTPSQDQQRNMLSSMRESLQYTQCRSCGGKGHEAKNHRSINNYTPRITRQYTYKNSQ